MALVPGAGFLRDRYGVDREVWGVTLPGSLPLGDNMTLSSISAYRTFDSLEVNDPDGISLPLLTAANQGEAEQGSQELRVNFDNDGPLTAFAGASALFNENGCSREAAVRSPIYVAGASANCDALRAFGQVRLEIAMGILYSAPSARGGARMKVTGYTRRDAVRWSAGLSSAAALAGVGVEAAPAREPANEDAGLQQVLGAMPPRPAPSFTVIETVAIEGGKRLKIEYLAEPASALLHEPEDRIRAYLFVPDHAQGARLPAILAIHQDGPNTHIGKKETAGLEGDANLFYGLELFRRGYVVLCADRFYHAERRRGAAPDSVDAKRDLDLLNHRVGQLVLHGRTALGKEAHDCTVGVDILASLAYVDSARIGAIGHSAGGLALVFAMFLDPRIRAGVSSCGYFDLVRFYDEKAPKRRLAVDALPGLARFGSGAGYIAGIAPRPLLFTRGLWEWGQDGHWRQASIDHVEETRRLVAEAAPRYRAAGASDALRALYFDENGGNHDFPAGVRREAFAWLEARLKPI